jgi:hypothetical protein
LTARICHLVEELDARATGMPHWMALDGGVDRAFHIGKVQVAAEIASGMPCSRRVIR